MNKFAQEFQTLNYVINKSDDILLFAHSRPDSDTVGSVLALRDYVRSLGKNADIACFDPFPLSLSELAPGSFLHPDKIDWGKYKIIIACDSVERGFHKVRNQIKQDQVTVLIDHHPDVASSGDINIMKPEASSVCELIFEFFSANKIEVTREMATYLLMGILGDTGMFQHANTTPRAMEIASHLMKKGAPLVKIIGSAFSNKNICTLKLWGRAFERAKINPRNGMIISVLSKRDLEECGATLDVIAQVAGILNTVPGTKFSLVLSERGDGVVKGSLRSEEYKGVDVSEIASRFGGGGHKLASGFEVKGKIVETEEGWRIE
jgi:phosphoesterase RecJ-like protein